MLAILWDLDLEDVVTAAPPDEKTHEKEYKIWKKRDAKMRTRIELAVGNSETIYLLGASTAKQMWDQLTTIKESWGKLGILAARRALFRATAPEDFDMTTHITDLRRKQEELHLMGSKLPDDDFAMILLTSLPEPWDNFTSGYLGSQGNAATINLPNLIGVLLDEERRHKQRGDSSSSDTALQARGKETRECHNCKKKGHLAKDCRGKAGGKEGQGLRSRKGKRDQAHQAQGDDASADENLTNFGYMATLMDFSKDNWLMDCSASTHVCTTWEMFIDYMPVDSTIKGLGALRIVGRGTVNLNFTIKGKCITHHLQNVTHVLDAPNCLVSQGRFMDAGGRIESQDDYIHLKKKDGTLVGIGRKVQKLYLQIGRAHV